MRILFLSRWFPHPANNGAKIRVKNILKQLARHHEVSLLTFAEASDQVDSESVGYLRTFCASVRVVPFRPYRTTNAHTILGLLSPQPRWLVGTRSPEMIATAIDEAGKYRPDLVMAFEMPMVPYALAIPDVPRLLEELEVLGFYQAASRPGPLIGRARASLTWLKLAAYLRRTLPRFAACTVVSELERSALRTVVPDYDEIHVIPNGVDVASFDARYGPPRPNTLVFAGALTYDANLDAAAYFLAEIFPRVRRAIPDVKLKITGRHEGVDLSGLARGEGVELTGYVPDIRQVVAESWASVVPLRRGGGTRLKILESMAIGTPIVSTSKGAEGLDVLDRENIMLADEPQDFAARIVELLRSPAARAHLAAGGRRLVKAKYDWPIVGRDLDALLARLGPTKVA